MTGANEKLALIRLIVTRDTPAPRILRQVQQVLNERSGDDVVRLLKREEE